MAEYKICFSVAGAFGAQISFEAKPGVSYEDAAAAIDTMRKRLCHQASAETRAYAEDFKAALRETEPELSDVLVPNCVYRCGCPEMQTCGLWERMGWETGGCIASQHIDERYDVYNLYFYAHRKETERAAE